jgi:hypothetical protein
MNHEHDRSIVESIRKMAGLHGKLMSEVYLGEVQTVSIDKRTCDILTVTNDSDVYIAGVRLQAAVGSGILIVPSIGSMVAVVAQAKQDLYVIQFSDIDQIIMFGGKNNGMVKVDDLVTRLNKIEDKVNEIITNFNSHTHISAAPGSPTATGLPQITSGRLTDTVRSDIENPKIKQ